MIVLVAFAVASIAAWRDQTRDDGTTRAIARWAHAHHVTRIAWPAARRSDVATLLAAHVTPVLVDDTHVVPQGLALNDTPIVVTRKRFAVPLHATTMLRRSDLVARLVDVTAAARVPLAPGESIGRQISRPYLYSPVYDSRELRIGRPYVVDVTLAPGRYTVSTEAFAPNQFATLKIAVTAGFVVLAHSNPSLSKIVQAPQRVSFRVGGLRPVKVRLHFATGTPDATVLMHAWQITRAGSR